METYSQDGQDLFVAKLFNNKKEGIFLDIGAYDGVIFSNSLYLEKHLLWKGICVEPNPVVFEQLKSSRKCICVNCCIGKTVGRSEFLSVSGAASMLSGLTEMFGQNHIDRIDEIIKDQGGSKQVFEVAVIPVKKILEENDMVDIDYCNIDVEGGEMSVLESIDFTKVKITIFTIENNYDSKEARNLLEPLGYKLIAKLGADEVFELNSKRYILMLKLRIKKLKSFASFVLHTLKRKLNLTG